MTAQFIPRDEVEWRRVRMLERADETFEYEFQLPRPLADWDVFAVWERERFHSMRDHLHHGDVLFDVGTEQGWCNLVYADMVGPSNMVLIEPTSEFWSNIQATWDRNYESPPLACYHGLISNVTNDERTTGFDTWPASAEGPLIDRNKYQYIWDNTQQVPEMRIDDFVARSGVTPDAITMDIEGAELLALQGAADTLLDRHPLVWVSVHPDMALEHYGHRPDEIFDFMASFGYTWLHLASDHEEHFLFQ